METNQNSRELEKYRKDIETIKGLLLKVEEKPIFELWIFFGGGLFFLLGTLLHYLTMRFMQFSLSEGFLKIWLPLLIIMIFIEPVALIRKLKKESLPLFSRSIIKLYTGIIGASIGICFVIFLEIKIGALSIMPATILALWGIVYFIYAQVVHSSLFAQGYVLIFSGIILYFTGTTIGLQFFMTGIIISLSFIAAGITEWRREKNKNV